jgi:hypothetical protein
VWAKVSTSATAMACAACIATAATLPAIGPAAEQLVKTASVKLSALSSLSFLDAASASPLYEDFLANPSEETANALLAVVGASTLGAVPLYAAFLADPGETTLGALLDGVYGTSATTLYTDFLADPSETTLGALLAVVGASTFGAVPVYSNALSGDLSRESGLSGIKGFNALPVYNALLNRDISALAPDRTSGAGGIKVFSAVPGYLGIDPPEVAPDIPSEAPMIAQASVAPEAESSSTTPMAQPAPPAAPVVEEEVTPTAADLSGADSQNITRNSQKFTPESIGDSPFLFGSSSPGGEGMRGYGSFLNKVGLGGGESPSGDTGGTG